MDIINPLLSECGRFAATPDTYGFTQQDNGAWLRPLGDDCDLVLTNADKSPFLACMTKQDADGNVLAKASVEDLNNRINALFSDDPLVQQQNNDPSLSQ